MQVGNLRGPFSYRSVAIGVFQMSRLHAAVPHPKTHVLPLTQTAASNRWRCQVREDEGQCRSKFSAQNEAAHTGCRCSSSVT